MSCFSQRTVEQKAILSRVPSSMARGWRTSLEALPKTLQALSPRAWIISSTVTLILFSFH